LDRPRSDLHVYLYNRPLNHQHHARKPSQALTKVPAWPQAVQTGPPASHLAGSIKAYQLELQANQVQFTGTKEAAGITRDASFEAARDRQIGTIITSLSRDMARRLEEAGRQRY
jgi:hypothetical protein